MIIKQDIKGNKMYEIIDNEAKIECLGMVFDFLVELNGELYFKLESK